MQHGKLLFEDVQAILSLECPDLHDSFQAEISKIEKENEGFTSVGNDDVFSLWLAGADLVPKASASVQAADQKMGTNDFEVLNKKKNKTKGKGEKKALDKGKIEKATVGNVAVGGLMEVVRDIEELKDLQDPYSFTMRERQLFAGFLRSALREVRSDFFL